MSLDELDFEFIDCSASVLHGKVEIFLNQEHRVLRGGHAFDELRNCQAHDVATGDVARIGTLARIGTSARIGTPAILGNDVAFKYF